MDPPLRLSGIGQISRRVEDTPQIGLSDIPVLVVQVGVGQLRDDLFLHRLAGDQRLDLGFRGLRGLLQDVLYDGVAAAVLPVGPHGGVF